MLQKFTLLLHHTNYNTLTFLIKWNEHTNNQNAYQTILINIPALLLPHNRKGTDGKTLRRQQYDVEQSHHTGVR